MASLIIVKLLIPVLLVMCAVRLIHAITKVSFRKTISIGFAQNHFFLSYAHRFPSTNFLS